MPLSVLDAFNEFFEMVFADSNHLKNEVYKLRHQVYCIETGFESPESFPEKIEFDEYDKQSLHCLIRHRKTDSYMATARLILPDINNIENLFPIEKHTQFDNFELLKNIPRDIHLAEASRFCVSKEFKRRKNEPGTLLGITNNSAEVFSPDEKRIFPHISIALIACLMKMFQENNIKFCYGTLEPAWKRFLAAAGIDFVGIGPMTEYHGMRQPCVVKVSDISNSVAKKNPAIWSLVTNNGQYG